MCDLIVKLIVISPGDAFDKKKNKLMAHGGTVHSL